jgi:hypothetical protein
MADTDPDVDAAFAHVNCALALAIDHGCSQECIDRLDAALITLSGDDPAASGNALPEPPDAYRPD